MSRIVLTRQATNRRSPILGLVAARRVVDRYLPRAPLERSPLLSSELGADVFLKIETFKPTRTFKVRGALNKIASLDGAARSRGVVAASGGTRSPLLLTPLAATSFNRAIKWLGAARWQRLHRLVYAIAGLAILHFFWMRAGKNDFNEVAVYAAILGALLGWRVWHAARRRARG